MEKTVLVLIAMFVFAMSSAFAGECVTNIDCGIGAKCVGAAGNKYCQGK